MSKDDEVLKKKPGEETQGEDIEEEFTDEIPQSTEGSDTGLFGDLGDSTQYNDSALQDELDTEQEIRYAQTVAELSKEDAADAYSLHHAMQALRRRKQILELGANPNSSNLENYVQTVVKTAKVKQRTALKKEMQAEVERRSLEEGIRGIVNRVKKKFGLRIKLPKNPDMEDVYQTVVNTLYESRAQNTANLQAKVEAHDTNVTKYAAQMNEYLRLIQEGLAAVERSQARKNIIEMQLAGLREQRRSLANLVAARPHDRKIQNQYTTAMEQIRTYEEELFTLTEDLNNATDDLEDNDVNFNHYAGLVKQERNSKTIANKSRRTAARDVADLDQQKERGNALSGIQDTVLLVAKSEAEYSKVSGVVNPQNEATNQILGKVDVYADINSHSRRTLDQDSSMNEMDMSRDLRNREVYKNLRVKYG